MTWQRLDGRGKGKRDAGRLSITWAEQGGRKVDPAGQPGFGTGLITRGAEYELGGTARLELRPEGVRYSLQIPCDGNLDPSAE